MTKRGQRVAHSSLAGIGNRQRSVRPQHQRVRAAFVAQLYGAIGIVSEGMAAAALAGVEKGGISRDG